MQHTSAESDIVVAIWMVTYNHEKYISCAIENIVSQNTDFAFKLFIGEDCSTDNTRERCISYKNKYPDKIELLLMESNNIKKNVENVWSACINSGAKYIAMCEGDDYWIDNNKLQKQVDYLEMNPKCSMCFTDVEVLDDDGRPRPHPFPDYNKNIYTIDDIISRYTIPTPTLLFRNCLKIPMPLFFRKTAIGDIALELYLADKGDAGFINEKTAVYRQHGMGLSKDKEFNLRLDRALFDLLDDFNVYTNGAYNKQIRQKLFPLSKLLLMYGSGQLTGRERKKHIARMFRGYFKYMTVFNAKEILYYFIVLRMPFLLKRANKTAEA